MWLYHMESFWYSCLIPYVLIFVVIVQVSKYYQEKSMDTYYMYQQMVLVADLRSQLVHVKQVVNVNILLTLCVPSYPNKMDWMMPLRM